MLKHCRHGWKMMTTRTWHWVRNFGSSCIVGWDIKGFGRFSS